MNRNRTSIETTSRADELLAAGRAWLERNRSKDSDESLPAAVDLSQLRDRADRSNVIPMRRGRDLMLQTDWRPLGPVA